MRFAILVTETGLKAVFLKERPMLLRLVVARLSSRDEADDALQDIALEVDRTEDREPIVQPAAHLHRMASTLAADRRVTAARSSAHEAAWPDLHLAAEEQPDAERGLLARERLLQIEKTLADMPDQMRTAFRLYRVEEQPRKDIAVHLGLTVGKVEDLLRGAMRQISVDGAGDAAEAPAPHRSSGEGDSHRGR